MCAKGDVVVDFHGNVFVVDECTGGPLGVAWVRDVKRDWFRVYTGELKLASTTEATDFMEDWNACIQFEIKELLDLCFTPTSNSTREQTDS